MFNFMVNNSCVTLGISTFEHAVDVILCKCVKVVNGHDMYTFLWVSLC